MKEYKESHGHCRPSQLHKKEKMYSKKKKVVTSSHWKYGNSSATEKEDRPVHGTKASNAGRTVHVQENTNIITVSFEQLHRNRKFKLKPRTCPKSSVEVVFMVWLLVLLSHVMRKKHVNEKNPESQSHDYKKRQFFSSSVELFSQRCSFVNSNVKRSLKHLQHLVTKLKLFFFCEISFFYNNG